MERTGTNPQNRAREKIMASRLTVTIPIGEKYRKEWKDTGEALGHGCAMFFRAKFISLTMHSKEMVVIIDVHKSHVDLVKQQIRKAMKDQKIPGVKITEKET